MLSCPSEFEAEARELEGGSSPCGEGKDGPHDLGAGAWPTLKDWVTSAPLPLVVVRTKILSVLPACLLTGLSERANEIPFGTLRRKASSNSNDYGEVLACGGCHWTENSSPQGQAEATSRSWEEFTLLCDPGVVEGWGSVENTARGSVSHAFPWIS